MRVRTSRIILIALSAFILAIAQATANFPILFQTSQVLAQTTQDHKIAADRLLQQGINQFQNSQLEAALQSWQQALAIYKKINNSRSLGIILNNIGTIYRTSRKYSQALEFYQQALSIYRKIGYRSGEGVVLSNIGTLYEAYDENFHSDKKALEYYQQALGIAKETGNRY